jgi:hypothetical protein
MLMQKIYKCTKIHPKRISLNGKFKLTDPALFYKSMLCMFLEPCYFNYTMNIFWDVLNVLNENVFSKGYDWVLERKRDLWKW